MDIILATGNEKINNFIISNLVSHKVVATAANQNALLSQCDRLQPEVIILSTLLPGGEDIREVVYKSQVACNCRVIILTPKPHSVLQDLFFLGVRDFIFDPINPIQLLNMIKNPTNYKDAAKIIKETEPSNKLKVFFNKITESSDEPLEFREIINGLLKTPFQRFKEDEDSVTPEMSLDSREIIIGLLMLLNKTPQHTTEDNLVSIEQGIVTLIQNGGGDA